MLIGAAEIRKLIPHSGDMSLLSGVTRWDAMHITCTANSHRNANNPLARDGKVHALTGIEFAAQAMAVHGGLTGLVGQRPRAGFLVNVRDVHTNVECLSDFQEDLQIDAEQLVSGSSSVTYAFSIHVGSRQLMSGRAMVILDTGEMTS
ncbi:MAG TPA: hydroxymyristoyl-ACP dehydratase [Gallionella sp.]